MGELCVEALVAALDEARAERDALKEEVAELKELNDTLSDQYDMALNGPQPQDGGEQPDAEPQPKACGRCGGTGLVDKCPIRPTHTPEPWTRKPKPLWQCPSCVGSGIVREQPDA